MLDRASEASGEAPRSFRILPSLGVLHVSGKTTLMKQLLADARVCAASLEPSEDQIGLSIPS